MIDGSTVYEYWNCPMRFIPKNVIDFLTVHGFYARHPSSPFPSFEECSARYLKASAYYEAKTAEYVENLKKQGLGGR